MEQFWNYGPMFVRELQEHYEEPRPNFNTLSNQVHTLMEDGFWSARPMEATTSTFLSFHARHTVWTVSTGW